jgi:hypothetical protein
MERTTESIHPRILVAVPTVSTVKETELLSSFPGYPISIASLSVVFPTAAVVMESTTHLSHSFRYFPISIIYVVPVIAPTVATIKVCTMEFPHSFPGFPISVVSVPVAFPAVGTVMVSTTEVLHPSSGSPISIVVVHVVFPTFVTVSKG